MRQVLDVDILTGERPRRAVALISLAVLASGVAVDVVLAFALGFTSGWGIWLWIGALAALYLVSLPVHELIHGACFKLFGGKGARVRFGYASGMLYAQGPTDILFSRLQFTVIVLAPFAVLSAAYAWVGWMVHDALLAWTIFFLHAMGCAGDMYYAYLIARHPEGDACQNTDCGFRLLATLDEKTSLS